MSTKHIKQNKNQNPRENNNFISRYKWTLLFTLFLFITAAALFYKTYKPFKQQTVKKTVVKQVLVKRSQDKGIIDRALTGKAVDVATGKIVKAARIFSYDDKTVYLELDLLNAPKGTVIDYIRYKEGRYVDHGEVALANSSTKNILFDWTISQVFGARRDGRWKVATYTDGILAKRVAYEIRNNKVSRYYLEPITPTDPDFRLADVLSGKYQ